MSVDSLAGRRVLVTGAAGGVGAAVAVAAARAGAAAVVLSDRRQDDLSALAAEVEAVGARAVTIGADLSAERAVVGLAKDALQATGGIDVLVNSAGVHERAMAADTATDRLTSELWNVVMAVNLTAPWLLMRELAPAMRDTGGGTVVNIASQLGIVGTERSPAYTTSKAGLIQLTRSAAVDLAPLGIRCNCVAPGAIETAMTNRIFAAAPDPGAARADALSTYLIKRFGDVGDVARAVCFLASDASSWTTGSCLVVDGGQTAWR
ncbi:SDR family oxidoreductase [Spirillospora sp. NPDC047279]|uniref:SDR family NAD(P)-dependent oxidoreductase n=1 Tax=Spirillospora sp. NPDC047279 TaxID=3155478 RepID=UPI0033FE6542